MPIVEIPKVDYFSIVVLMVSVIVTIFLIIVSIYFFNLINLRPPNTNEANFLFWTSILLAIILFVIGIYSLIRLFTYKVPIYEPDTTRNTITTNPTYISPITTSNIPRTTIVQPIPQPIQQQYIQTPTQQYVQTPPQQYVQTPPQQYIQTPIRQYSQPVTKTNIPRTTTVQGNIPKTTTVQGNIPKTTTVQGNIPKTTTVQGNIPKTKIVQPVQQNMASTENIPKTTTVTRNVGPSGDVPKSTTVTKSLDNNEKIKTNKIITPVEIKQSTPMSLQRKIPSPTKSTYHTKQFVSTKKP
jgi:hypothetical protein